MFWKSTLLPGRATGLVLVLVLAALSSANTCASISGLESVDEVDQSDEDTILDLAASFLETHQLSDARDLYAAAVESDPNDGQALAGLGLLNLLLLPDHPAINDLLSDLGSHPIDMQRDFYGPEGALAMYEARIDPLKIEEHMEIVLPWNAEERQDRDLIFSKLDPALSGRTLVDRAVLIAQELTEIADLLDAATRDPSFSAFVFPRFTFHGRTFIGLRVAELDLVSGASRIAAAAIYWVASYDWDIIAEELSPKRSLTNRVSAFSAIAFKTISGTERLEQAKILLESGLTSISSSVTAGFGDVLPGILLWSDLTLEEVVQIEFFYAHMAHSLRGETRVTEEGTKITAHLGRLVEGRTLGEGQGILAIDKSQENEQVVLDYDSVQSLILDDVLTPNCHPDPAVEDPDCPRELSEGSGSIEPWTRISEKFRDSLSRDYGF
jgi:hypothetical protein